MDDTLNDELHDDLTDESGIEVQELEQVQELHASFEPALPDPNQRWHGQLRRAGSARELPGPQPYRDFPTWLTEPHKNPALELELELEEASV
jgi:hypothetical protein